ncbi:kinase-like domain-containing protein [Coprinopsis sp. MPI-PUGE-AT-0042]|nr:kinase-like domain-containing protein [Coprinopsis sp. MPI-PUGE-AT-0042]
MAAFLDLYEPLDVIGNGSFGIIRKVRRKSDGLIFARKELNFERMSERDRKQIVAEVNILKDLQHEHIVRYHDRHVDRDAGILYIIMEYCGGGDLSTIIKQSAKQGRPIQEDVIWNYFMQILLALCHCHHPNGTGTKVEASRRPQILHRDLKPDNVFLDESNNVKLGDFGLSKALPHASFANTYVGTPYYMSPELMQEKAYDSKSDIWSLGCLIYELAATKPPFHEAKTHNELSILIRNGRIPPLPRGYSQALFGVIKAMLNLNPAMRPSAAQLLQHERLELVFKVAETEKMLSTVKSHKNTLVTRERELATREQAIVEREAHLTSLFAQKDSEISQLQHHVSSLQLQLSQAQTHAQQLQAQLSQTSQVTQHEVDQAIKRAVARREEELRVLVVKREQEVAEAMRKREEEIMDAVRRREAEVCEAWTKREGEIREEVEVSIKAVEERIKWIQDREEEMKEEEDRLEVVREELEEREREIEEMAKRDSAPRRSPLEDIENVEPNSSPAPTITFETPAASRKPRHFESFDTTPRPTNRVQALPALETPITRPSYTDFLPSAMKGVVLTATGEPLATPSPAELATLFNSSPPVGLNFGKIFDFDKENEEQAVNFPGHHSDEEEELPPSPTARKEKELRRKSSRDSFSSNSTSTGANGNQLSHSATTTSTTRIRRPSIRKTASVPAKVFEQGSQRRSTSREPTSRRTSNVGTSESAGSIASSSSTSSVASSSTGPTVQPKPLPHPHLSATATKPPSSTGGSSSSRVVSGPSSLGISRTTSAESTPKYDLGDEENLPSPFLKRVSRSKSTSTTSTKPPSTSSEPSAPPTRSSSKDPTGPSESTPVATERPGSATKTVTRKRPSAGNMLRTMAAANVVRGKLTPSNSVPATIGRAGKV